METLEYNIYIDDAREKKAIEAFDWAMRKRPLFQGREVGCELMVDMRISDRGLRRDIRRGPNRFPLPCLLTLQNGLVYACAVANLGCCLLAERCSTETVEDIDGRSAVRPPSRVKDWPV